MSHFLKTKKGEKTINAFVLILYLLLSFILASLIITFVCERSKISGSSMHPHFKNKDQILIEKLSYRFRKPRRFEVVAILMGKQRKREYYIKRIVALPNERIQIKKGCLYVNGQKLDEHYGLEPIKRAGLARRTITLNDHEYFVLGDNRNDSLDSRDERVGMVVRKEIIGRAWIKISRKRRSLSSF